tara:strand:- start:3934 stop:5064 length:1131 start_codon:yes stop_codon:yes gene_type:complete
MQNYELILKSPIAKSFMCKKAANSLDIDVEKKSIHHVKVKADITSDYNIGLIVGASGSGKTTFTKHIFGNDCFNEVFDSSLPIIDQFAQEYSYDERAKILTGVGLSQVPCWVRPAFTLSNGQQARAKIALTLADNKDLAVIDEWTSVVDRTVAKVMSHAVQKHVRRQKSKIVLCSCHYDVVEWLDPDWIIDLNKQIFINRRCLRRGERKETLKFSIRRIERSSWKNFSKYHYLSDKLAGGKYAYFGLFIDENQIGFVAYSNYVPPRKGKKIVMHFNRLVIHPDYVGFNLGVKFINITSKIMVNDGFKVMGKFSSIPVSKALTKDKYWRLNEIKRTMKQVITGSIHRKTGYREKVKTYSFKFLPNNFTMSEYDDKTQ